MGLPKEETKKELKEQKLTFEEYIKIEQENDQKYEYHDGFIVAMAGGTMNHARICGNVYGKIWSLLDSKYGECDIFNSDTKLGLEDKNKYLYPDAMIVCGETEGAKHQNHALTNPKVIIEVLSKSTQDYDKEDKFSLYKQIQSLEYYVLIAQNKPQIEMYRKMRTEKQNGRDKKNEDTISLWQIETITGIDKILSFPTLDLEIPFTAIYRKIKFENL